MAAFRAVAVVVAVLAVVVVGYELGTDSNYYYPLKRGAVGNVFNQKNSASWSDKVQLPLTDTCRQLAHGIIAKLKSARVVDSSLQLISDEPGKGYMIAVLHAPRKPHCYIALSGQNVKRNAADFERVVQGAYPDCVVLNEAKLSSLWARTEDMSSVVDPIVLPRDHRWLVQQTHGFDENRKKYFYNIYKIQSGREIGAIAGRCAAYQLLDWFHENFPGRMPECMAEVFYDPDEKSDQHKVKVLDSDGNTHKYGHGELTPSCLTCQVLLPGLITRIKDSYVDVLRKNLEKMQEHNRVQKELAEESRLKKLHDEEERLQKEKEEAAERLRKKKEEAQALRLQREREQQLEYEARKLEAEALKKGGNEEPQLEVDVTSKKKKTRPSKRSRRQKQSRFRKVESEDGVEKEDEEDELPEPKKPSEEEAEKTDELTTAKSHSVESVGTETTDLPDRGEEDEDFFGTVVETDVEKDLEEYEEVLQSRSLYERAYCMALYLWRTFGWGTKGNNDPNVHCPELE